MASFRTIFQKMVPGAFSLEGTEGEAFLYTLSLMLDALEARARQALEQRFPSRASASALRRIGSDRRILRGRTEATAHYVERLRRWRYPRGHRVRGNAYAALEQISEYFGGVRCWTIAANGGRRELRIDGATLRTQQSWAWDTVADLARFWIVLAPSNTFGVTAIDISVVSPGEAIGQTGISVDDARAIRGLFKAPTPWCPAGVTPMWLMVGLDIAFPEPTPDATWAHWGIDDAWCVRRPSRSTIFAYIALRPYRYTGNPAAFSAAAQTIQAGDYIPDPTHFSTTFTAPVGGSTITADAATFSLTETLPDDADPL